MNKSLFKYFIILFIVIGISIIVFAKYKSFFGFSSFLTTISPKGTYTVTLSGQKGRPIFFTNEVYFNVVKYRESFVLNQELHSGDSGDISFELAYPNHRWLDENALIFNNQKKFNLGSNDKLIVRNATNKTIKYMKIYSSEDKFLLFDIQPKAEIKLFTSSSLGNYPGIYIKGEFINGENFDGGSGFKISKGMKGPFLYYLNINNKEIKIESPQLKKYKCSN